MLGLAPPRMSPGVSSDIYSAYPPPSQVRACHRGLAQLLHLHTFSVDERAEPSRARTEKCMRVHTKHRDLIWTSSTSACSRKRDLVCKSAGMRDLELEHVRKSASVLRVDAN